MSSPDLHPDELLDKDARGELSASESVSLREHLARCAVCRFEQRARLDFQDELAAGGPELEVEHLVAKVILGARRAAQPAPAPGPRRRRTAPVVFAAIAAAMTLAGVAVAGRWAGVWPHGPEPIAAPQVSSSVPERAVRSPRRSSPVPRVPDALLEPMVVAPEPVFASPVRTAAPAPSAAPHFARPEAAALFAQANRARSGGQHAGAVRLYRELLVRFPTSPETRLSRATLGRLLLDDGDAQGALEQIDAYLRDGDLTLREEAIANRAMALGRLGRAGDEAAAWSELLTAYPQSIHAARARARVGEIGPR